MALIKCDECGKEYSNKAPACPNCANPTENKKTNSKKKKNSKKRTFSTGTWVLIISITIIAIISITEQPNYPTTSQDFSVTIDKGGIYKTGYCYVKGKIKNNSNYNETECTLTFKLVSDSTKEYIGEASTTFYQIKAKETLNFEASGVCNTETNQAKWKYDIKCGKK